MLLADDTDIPPPPPFEDDCIAGSQVTPSRSHILTSCDEEEPMDCPNCWCCGICFPLPLPLALLILLLFMEASVDADSSRANIFSRRWDWSLSSRIRRTNVLSRRRFGFDLRELRQLIIFYPITPNSTLTQAETAVFITTYFCSR